MPLASLDDINANLDGTVVKADDDNTKLVLISVGRMVRGYLARAVDNTVLGTWATPDTTPEIIREIAGKLAASQLYFNAMSGTTLQIEDNNIAQRLYDEAMEMLRGTIDGSIVIAGIVENAENLELEDFFPVDDTDRSFTKAMEL